MPVDNYLYFKTQELDVKTLNDALARTQRPCIENQNKSPEWISYVLMGAVGFLGGAITIMSIEHH